MITLLLIITTWYLTKLFYTKTLRIELPQSGDPDIIQAKCSKCAQIIVVHRDNMRTPFYCNVCK
jgi:hypothetical protein